MADVERMRNDYRAIAPWLRNQGWQDSDLAELSQAIKEAVEQGGEILELWAEWLSDKEAELEAIADRCRRLESSIKARAARLARKAA